MPSARYCLDHREKGIHLTRAIASKIYSGLQRASIRQSFENWLVITWLVEPIPKIRCDCPALLCTKRDQTRRLGGQAWCKSQDSAGGICTIIVVSRQPENPVP